MTPFQLHRGDCIDVLKTMADNSVDSIVTDPPYGLSDHTEKEVRACMAKWLMGEEYTHTKAGFMGKTWDSFVPGPTAWAECYRVLKPGGYLLAFASTRTDDLMSFAIRLAGFRKHPFIGWIFGSGFPKAANLSKALDKAAGERERDGARFNAVGDGEKSNGGCKFRSDHPDYVRPHGITDAAKQWDGWAYGLQSLKPAIEPCLMFQKPHEGKMTENVAEWGVGAINIDGCRVTGESTKRDNHGGTGDPAQWRTGNGGDFTSGSEIGRWPANLLHDGSPEVIAAFPQAGGQQGDLKETGRDRPSSGRFGDMAPPKAHAARVETETSAARFFYVAKASRSDRNAGLDEFDEKVTDVLAGHRSRRMEEVKRPDGAEPTRGRNTHPTVKPTDLMAYLCRLVTPPGGTVLDPFMGSGSTGKAAMREGFKFIGIEMESEYMAIAEARIQHEINVVASAAEAAAIAAAPPPQLNLFEGVAA